MAHEDFNTEIDELKQRFGVPKRVDFAVDMTSNEFELVRRSLEKGRTHDVTLFIRYQNKFVVIEKHAYAKTGIFRAPSGGALPSETLEEAARRESREETGLDIELEHFVLEAHVLLRNEMHPDVNWVSYVFLATAIGGQIGAEDINEISDVQLRTREELLNDVNPLMLASGLSGFRYRALLTSAFFEQLDALGIPS